MMKKGFTLIELLVVISIIGILLGLSVFGLQGARTSSRDARRKADLETIRSGLEIFKADCDRYPATLPAPPNPLIGIPAYSSACLAANTYISRVPNDPIPGTYAYVYTPDATGTTYTLCAALEQGTSVALSCVTCGTKACNYLVQNP